MVVTVYGVVSTDEARQFESAGANVIGTFLGELPRGRIVDEATALSIARSLSSAHLCVEALTSTRIEPEAVLRTEARWIQTPWGPPAPAEWRHRLAELGVGWVLARVPANEDDDPTWVHGRMVEYGEPAPAWVQVELCPDLEDGWPIVREPNPDELDIEDVDQIAAKVPLVVSVPMTTERLVELRALLPHVHGVALTLDGDNGRIPGATKINPKDALAIVSALRAG